MAAWVLYTPDHDYYALAVNDQCRDIFLEEIAVRFHREGYAEPYPVPLGRPQQPQRWRMGSWLEQMAAERAAQNMKEAAE